MCQRVMNSVYICAALFIIDQGISIDLTTTAPKWHPPLAHTNRLPQPKGSFQCCPRYRPPTPQAPAAENADSGRKNLVAVASGKGGVGKTTVAVNLAIALKNMGASVGVLDADVYGPNVPLMLGTDEEPRAISDRQILPVEAYGLKLISMGLLSPGDKPIIWRGPMLHSVMQQFLRSVQWGELDYLIIDLPPGTGDVQLSLIQTVPLTGAVVVTTPSVVALADVRKAIEMFRQVNVEVLGVIENMSYFSCARIAKAVLTFSGTEKASAWPRPIPCPCLAKSKWIAQIASAAIPGNPWLHWAKMLRARRSIYEMARAVSGAC